LQEGARIPKPQAAGKAGGSRLYTLIFSAVSQVAAVEYPDDKHQAFPAQYPGGKPPRADTLQDFYTRFVDIMSN
jgi:hypothetical protein